MKSWLMGRLQCTVAHWPFATYCTATHPRSLMGHSGNRHADVHFGGDAVVRAAGRAAEVVGARRLLGAEGRGRGARLPQERAVRAAVPGVDGDRQGFLGRAVLRTTAARHAEA